MIYKIKYQSSLNLLKFSRILVRIKNCLALNQNDEYKLVQHTTLT